MLRIPICIGSALVLSACAGPQHNVARPVAWAQAPSEAKALPVGSVIFVEKLVYTDGHQSGSSNSAGLAVGLAVVGSPLAAIAAAPMIEGLRPGEWFFRHKVRLRVSGEIITRDEFYEYKVGECVALRTEPYMVVPSLPGACD
jgi:hypothetical protein